MPSISSNPAVGRQQAIDRVQTSQTQTKDDAVSSKSGHFRNRPVIVRISRNLIGLTKLLANALPPTVRNVFLRLEQPVTQRLSGSINGATSATTGKLESIRFSNPPERARSEGYQAVKEAGNDLVPLLKKDVRREQGMLFTDTVKNATKANVKNVSATGNNIEAGNAGAVLDHAVLAKLAYKGVNRKGQDFSLPAGYKLASSEDLPAALRPLYNQQSGLLEMPQKGAKALLAKKDDTLVIAFAGTQPKGNRQHTIQTDIQQRLGFFDPMYRDAAGITSMLLDHPANQGRTVRLAGHSLGGGLAMFSAIANTASGNDRQSTNRAQIQSFGYNAAGLSTSYLAALGTDRVSQAAENLLTVRVKGDVVSSSGNKVGTYAKGHNVGKTVTLSTPEGGALPAPRAHPGKAVINTIQKATGLEAQRC